MTLPIWQSLQKSQDDPETIEQAIARLIAEHEADPEAHLGAGESLEAHKSSDVIDHPPSSIVGDKYNYETLLLNTPFVSSSMLLGQNFTVALLKLTVTGEWDPSVEGALAYFTVPDYTVEPEAGDLVLRTFAAVEQSGDGWVEWGFFNGGPLNDHETEVIDGIYFKYADGNLYAVVRQNPGGGGLDYSSDLGAFGSIPTADELQISYSADDEIVRFFWQGVQVASLDVSSYGSFVIPDNIAWRAYQADEEEYGVITSNFIFFALGPTPT